MANRIAFSRQLIATAVLFAMGAAYAPGCLGSGGVRTVAITGLPMPGLDAPFGDVGHRGVSLNNHGDVAFTATPTLGAYDFMFQPRSEGEYVLDEVLYATAGGNKLRLIAQEGISSPDGNVFINLAEPRITDGGDTLFRAYYLDGPAPRPSNFLNSLWRHRRGQPNEQVVASGQPATGTEAVYSSLRRPSIANTGAVAYFAALDPPAASLADYQGIWSATASESPRLLARRGTTAPGTSSYFHDLSQPFVGGAGHTAFTSTLEGPNVSRANDKGLWFARPSDAPILVLREGDSAPGLAGIANNIDSPIVNASGDLVFTAGVSFASSGAISVGNSLGHALYRYSDSDGVSLIAAAGQPAPGLDGVFGVDSFSYRTFFSPAIGANGHIAFLGGATVDGESVFGIWRVGPNHAVDLVATEGEQAPGSDETFWTLDEAAVNANGQVAFRARTTDPTDRFHGIWAQDTGGVLQSIIAVGDLLDVSDDPMLPDLRVVQFVGFNAGGGSRQGSATGFNDTGQVAFFARFTDGTSGVFVSNAVAIPEPTTLTVALLAATVGVRRPTRPC
ncbi:MAG: choice-of-anchor tandem repeat NxxGxxAF-containing protein [Planctomycetota bacterium]